MPREKKINDQGKKAYSKLFTGGEDIEIHKILLFI